MGIKDIKKTAIVIFSTWFGCGFLPLAPGTFASAASIPLLFWMRNCSLWIRVAVLFSFILLAIGVSEYAERIFKKKDPKQVVIDEVAGMLVCCLFVPFKLRYIFTGFILFRLLDIIKPFPIRKTESLTGGFGIVIDDVLAGAISYGLMLILVFFLWHGDLKEFYSFFS